MITAKKVAGALILLAFALGFYVFLGMDMGFVNALAFCALVGASAALLVLAVVWLVD